MNQCNPLNQLNPRFLFGRASVALVLGGLLLGSCGGNGASTSTPSSTLGTDSAATKVGGMPDSLDTGSPLAAPASGSETMNSAAPGTSGTGASSPGSSPAGTAGTPTVGGTGASGTTNSTGAN